MDVMVIFYAVVIGFGIYMFVSAFNMKKSGKISATILAKEEVEKCKDIKGFIAFISIKEMIFGVVFVIVGILGIVNSLIISIGNVVYVELLLFLGSFLWFQRELRVAREKFLK